MYLAFARTVELSRATSNGAALGLLNCWQKAKERFGPELMAGFVSELNIDGLAQGPQVGPESSDPTRVSVMLEYSPKALNDAAKGADWEAEVAILLGLFAVLWRCGRAAIVAQSEAGETRPSRGRNVLSFFSLHVPLAISTQLTKQTKRVSTP